MNYERANIRLRGMTAEDPCYARMLLPLYADALDAVAAYTYRSLQLAENLPILSQEFERLAEDSLGHVRLLGELIEALGGNPTVYTSASAPLASEDHAPPSQARFLMESLCEERRAVERCETLMGKTDDRVVRSILSQIVRDKQLHLQWLSNAS